MQALLTGIKELSSKAGAVPVSALAAKDYTFLYFSASWCGPCKQFTPLLANFYNKHKDAKNFEIVFVSGDRDEASFKTYFSSMPWLGFFDQATYRTLMAKYKLSGIPSLILLNKEGELVSKNGRMNVMGDAEAVNFPWPAGFKNDIVGTPQKHDGTKVDADEIAANNDYALVYFSASWCGPCKQFTPKLVDFYKKNKESKKFEVVFMSLDRDEASFNNYFASMPWLAVAPGTSNQMAAQTFGVQGIPSLSVYDLKNKKIIPNGVTALLSDPAGEKFPWVPTAADTFGGAKTIRLSNANKDTVTLDAFLANPEKDYTLLYFSASWCGPCKQFTPKLVEFYKNHKESKKFEVVFMSLDRDEASFDTYYSHMPWLAIYGEAVKNAAGRVGLEGIPTLVVLNNKTGEVVTTEGVEAVMGDADAAEFPWE